MPDVVFDACVLSNFALADSWKIVEGLYRNSAFIMDFVYAEILGGIRKGYEDLQIVRKAVREGSLGRIALSPVLEIGLFEDLSVSLGAGEASSIAAAKARGMVFACDDREARRQSDLLGVRLTGTIGILVKAVRGRILRREEADRIFARMIEKGFFSPIRSLKEIPGFKR